MDDAKEDEGMSIDGESEEEPFQDSGSEYDPEEDKPKSKRKKKQRKISQSEAEKANKTESKGDSKGASTSDSKSASTSGSKSASKSYKKKPKKVSTEEKIKLAELVKGEEIIHNIQHKLHSNSMAMTAAWERVAAKMEKSGKCLYEKYLTFNNNLH